MDTGFEGIDNEGRDGGEDDRGIVTRTFAWADP